MSNKISIKSNFIFNSIYQLSSIVVPLITMPYLSRVLLAEGLGAYSYAYSIAYYFYLFIRMGLHSYGNRTVAFVKNDKKELSKTFFEIYSFQMFIGIIMVLLYAFYVMVLAHNKMLAGVFIILVISGGIDLTWVLYGLEEFKITACRDIMIKVVTTVSVFIFVKNASDVWKYALIYCGGFMCSQIIAIPIVHGRVNYVRPSLEGIVYHIKPNFILFLPTIAVSIYKTMDKIMLGTMASEIELGYYHSCDRIINVPLALITALGTVMLPRISNILSKGDNTDETSPMFEKSIKFAMFISTSICLGIMTVSDIFVPLFYGKGFEKCIILFKILLPSCIFLAFANVIRTQYLLPRKMDKLFVVSLFLGAGVNLILNMILIPKYASAGAAIGTLAAEIVVCIAQSIGVYKAANIGKNIRNSIPFIISGTLMYLFFKDYVPLVQSQIVALLIKVVVSGAFYLVVLGVIYLILSMKKTIIRNIC